MKTVVVNASKEYAVHIGPGLLSGLGEAAAALSGGETVCIVSDSRVFPLYGAAARRSLEQAGFSVIHYTFPAGESSKNGSVFLELLNHLAENRLTRRDLVVALGGGVTGDLSGFAAACYLRGIRLIQIPTTLLAAVDSSVGGKTAIDLPAGKNLAGAFYQPSLVLCDTDTLATLPPQVFLDGCGEVIKYGILYDPQLFSLLEKTGAFFDLEQVIARCVELKRNMVMEDEFDTGARMKLNLGHTIGHGIEAASSFSVSHGMAVAAGIAMITRAAVKRGICPASDGARILDLLTRFGLPIDTKYPAETLYSYALSDKKRSGGTVNLIVPRRIGCCAILPTPVEQVQSWIQEGL